MKCTCGSPLTPRVMHRVDGPCYVVEGDAKSIFEDLMLDNRSHSRDCWEQQRCICGYYERQNADFEQRLKRAMEKYPDYGLDPRRWDMVAAPPDSAFIWRGDIDYAHALARHVGRTDLRIVPAANFLNEQEQS